MGGEWNKAPVIRRRFLALLALAPVVLPTALKGLVKVLAAVPQPANPVSLGELAFWKGRPVAWELEFDYGSDTGIAIGAVWDSQHPLQIDPEDGIIVLRTRQA